SSDWGPREEAYECERSAARTRKITARSRRGEPMATFLPPTLIVRTGPPLGSRRNDRLLTLRKSLNRRPATRENPPQSASSRREHEGRDRAPRRPAPVGHDPPRAIDQHRPRSAGRAEAAEHLP